MKLLQEIFGEGDQLLLHQMAARAFVISIACLILIRFSGRRSFGIGTPLDNVLAILLGAVMSRAVVGASPFFPVLAAGGTIAALHRLLAVAGLYSRKFGKLVKGEAKVVYENGEFIKKNLKYCRISKHDLMAGVRQEIQEDSLEHVKTIYVERNGHISVIKKENA
jgi:uncharacterized membrane protein YcaP (DUF421 family)